MSIKLDTPELKYTTTQGSVYACEYHIIWCTKFRRQCLSVEMQSRLKELVLERQADYGYNIRAIETMSDHIHLLISIDPIHAISRTIGRIKGYTAKVLREEFPRLKRMPCLWTRSKFVASTGDVTLDVIRAYVEAQKGV